MPDVTKGPPGMSRIRLVTAAALAAFCLPAGALAAPQAGDPTSSVVGGTPASEPYKFMASVQDTSGAHFCGGSLVAKAWVLTAAHCVDDREPESVQVMMGSHDRTKPGPIFKVTQIVVHEKYTGQGYDIALLRLDDNPAFKPIKIAGAKQKALWAPGEPSRVIGWGASIFLVGPGSDTLQEVDVPIVSESDCSLTNGPFGYDPTTEVCAGEDTGMKDSCQGDSGGPLMVNDAKGRWYQVGTVSWGIGCGFPLLYGVYGKVGSDPMRSWITTNTKAPTKK